MKKRRAAVRRSSSAHGNRVDGFMGVIGTLGFVGSLFFLSSGVSGNAIGNLSLNSTNILGTALFITGILACSYYFSRRR